ncbi:MAG: glutamine synthetase family protein [Candidatus Gracilibacteria bacterium]|jgi:glutamine synthetase
MVESSLKKSASKTEAKVEAEISGSSTITPRARDYDYDFVRPAHLLDLSYLDLEEKNLEIKHWRVEGNTSDELRSYFLDLLKKEKGIKAVTVFFSDMEGRLHALDYDKDFLIDSEDNLTFDGSSIRGFTAQKESDLRLRIDWTSFRYAPSDLFGLGKVLIFANVCDKDGSLYDGDFRARLASLSDELTAKGMKINVAPEIEGFLFKGFKAEQTYDEKVGFELVTSSGYFSSLPQDVLRKFIDKFAEVQRALGFQNEKDHPEVAPAQFELNFRYSIALDAADQIQLYKLLARQVASTMGLTACFLPKPVQGINGSGMHTNISLSKDGKNLFFDANGKHSLSEMAYKFATGVLYHANELCLTMNSSVNAYRRLDPHYEAPNEIKISATDRGSMVRVPIGNEKSARLEVRTVAPDSNPYLWLYTLIKVGLSGMEASASELKKMEEKVFGAAGTAGAGKVAEKLPGDIYAAIEYFAESEYMMNMLGKHNHQKYADLKRAVADRSPRLLGTRVKCGEVLYHHEVSNQLIWSEF